MLRAAERLDGRRTGRPVFLQAQLRWRSHHGPHRQGNRLRLGLRQPRRARDTSTQAFAVRWVGAFAAPGAETLNLQFRLPICYPCGDKLKFAVYLDGKQLEPTSPPTPTTSKLPPSGRNYGAVQHFAIPFSDTRPHELRIEYIQSARITGAGLSFEWTPSPELLQKQAVEAASKADAVIAFVGLTPRLEGEEMKVDAKGFSGGDRTDINLPDVQQQMLEAVAKTGKPVVVVLLNGSALAVNWAQENAHALLEAWYPGQSGGQAIAETLSGKNNPAGRLPVTFYTGVDQLPAFDDYSMANRTYRYFKGKPLYAFGDGLSYTTFAYYGLKLSAHEIKAGESLTVQVYVQNRGSVAGDEVAELYLTPPNLPLLLRSLSPVSSAFGFSPGASRCRFSSRSPNPFASRRERKSRGIPREVHRFNRQLSTRRRPRFRNGFYQLHDHRNPATPPLAL